MTKSLHRVNNSKAKSAYYQLCKIVDSMDNPVPVTSVILNNKRIQITGERAAKLIDLSKNEAIRNDIKLQFMQDLENPDFLNLMATTSRPTVTFAEKYCGT